LNVHRRLCADIPPIVTGLPDNTTDPDMGAQWYLMVARVQQAWNFLQTNGATAGGNRDVVVAVIDTGVDPTHEELVGNLWTNPGETAGNGVDDDQNGFIDDVHGCSVVSDPRSHSGDSSDYTGHGTHVAGIVAATAFNLRGGAGVAFNVQVMSVRAAQYSGVLTATDAAEGILYAVDHGAEVINMSFGGYQWSQIEFDALEMALHQSALVAAAGNDALPRKSAPLYPAALPYVLGVEATQPPPTQYLRCWFSNFGYDIAAPGESIFSTLPGNQYARWSGTSMAAPIVSGVAALMRSFFWQREVYSSRFLMGAIFGSKAFGEDPGFESAGLVDAYAALSVPPKPGVDLLENWLFDDPGISPENDNDGRVDSGETIHLGIELINRSGQADDVIAILEARALGAVQDDPYVSIDVPLVDFGGIGPFNTSDNGFLYDPEGVITNVSWPFVFTVSPDCPNDHVINFILTIDFRDGWDPEHPWYERISYFQYVVQRGRNVPAVIRTNTTLTSDQYWLVPGPVLVDSGATLTIAPGTQVQWGSVSDDPYNPGPKNGYILVRGALDVQGTWERPVSMFPSYLVAGQNTRILSEDNGIIDMRYAKVRNPDLKGVRSLDHCYLDWDALGATVAAASASQTVFHRLRGGASSLDIDRFVECLFDASWMPPKPMAQLYRSAILQDIECPLSITVPCSLRDTLTSQVPEEPFFLQLQAHEGSTYVLLPTEWPSLGLAESIASYYGGHVVSVPDATTEAFLESYIGAMPRLMHSYRFVLGLTDEGPAGSLTDFHWIDGTPVTFTSWASGYPHEAVHGPSHLVQVAYHNGDFVRFGWQNAVETPGFRDYDLHDWNLFVLRLPGEKTMEELLAPVASHSVHDHVRAHYRERVQYNAFLNGYWNPDLAHWLRVRAPENMPHGIVALQDNYWGTSSQTLLDHMIYDFYDNFTSAWIDYGTPPEHGYTNTYPFAEEVLINGISAVSVPELGMGRTAFTVNFNRDMNTNIQPFVAFGPTHPHTDFQITPRDEDFLEMTNGWISARTWRGDCWMTPVTGDGYHLMRISGAVAAEDPWLVSGYDVGRFRFRVQTMGVAAMRLQASGGEGYIKLTWQQDDYDLSAGYNVYRANALDGVFERLNTTLIPAGHEEFVDRAVTPAVPMFYRFTVVTTDFKESEVSNTASAAALDTIPPMLEHAALISAQAGRGLRVTARATDNVGVRSVTLYHRSLGDSGTFSPLAMNNVTAEEWSVTIGGSSVQAPGLEYYLKASDGISAVYSGNEALPHTVTVRHEPAVSSVTPNHGPARGGTPVTLAGVLFQTGASVQFGDGLATEVVVISPNQIACVTPTHYPATVDVRVHNPDHSTAVSLHGFRFESDDALVALPQASGDTGTQVEIPVCVADVTGLRAAALDVAWNTAVLQLMEIRLGPMAVGWSLSANTNDAGRARLSLASATAISGSGTLVILTCQVVGAPSASTPLTVERVVMNDGAIRVVPSHGRFEVAGLWVLAGEIEHFGGERVPNVALRLTGVGVHETSSGGDGTYGFSGLPTGSYTLQPDKNDGINGIGALDASYILQHEAGLLDLSDAQRLAADVNDNGMITSMDASYVLEYAVQLRALPFPGAGRTWTFIPSHRSYAPLNQDRVGENFTAILIGDITGNWFSGAAAPSAPAPPRRPPPGVRLAGAIPVHTSVLGVDPGDPLSQETRRLLFRAAEPVYSIEMELALTAVVASDVHATHGALAEGMLWAVNTNQPSTLRIALAGATPIHGAGILMILRVGPALDAAIDVRRVILNEGSLECDVDPSAELFDADADDLVDFDETDVYGTDPVRADTDNDGMEDGAEVVAGTNPRDGTSRLQWNAIVLEADGSRTLRWQGAVGRAYHVEYKDRLDAESWSLLETTVPAGLGMRVVHDRNVPAHNTRFYRLRLNTPSAGFNP